MCLSLIYLLYYTHCSLSRSPIILHTLQFQSLTQCITHTAILFSCPLSPTYCIAHCSASHSPTVSVTGISVIYLLYHTLGVPVTHPLYDMHCSFSHSPTISYTLQLQSLTHYITHTTVSVAHSLSHTHCTFSHSPTVSYTLLFQSQITLFLLHCSFTHLLYYTHCSFNHLPFVSHTQFSAIAPKSTNK